MAHTVSMIETVRKAKRMKCQRGFREGFTTSATSIGGLEDLNGEFGWSNDEFLRFFTQFDLSEMPIAAKDIRYGGVLRWPAARL